MSNESGSPGGWLKSQRNIYKLTQTEVAKEIAIHQTTLARWEKDKIVPTEPLVRSWVGSICLLAQIDDQEYLLGIALEIFGYVPTGDKAMEILKGTFGYDLQSLVSIAEDPILDLGSTIIEEFRRFGEVWRKCFEIKLYMRRTKNYSNVIDKIDKIIRNPSSKHIKEHAFDPRALAFLLDMAGSANYHLGFVHEARILIDHALTLGEPIGNDFEADPEANEYLARAWYSWLGSLHDNRSDIMRVSGDFPEALSSARKSYALSAIVIDKVSMARAKRKEALASLVRGAKADKTIEVCTDELENIDFRKNPKKTRNKYEYAKLLSTRGWAHLISESPELAIEDHEEALSIWNSLGQDQKETSNQYELLKCHRYIGDDHLQSGKDTSREQAKMQYEKARTLARKLGKDERTSSDPEVGMIYFGLARTFISKENRKSEDYLNRALYILGHGDDRSEKDAIRIGLVLRTKAKLHFTMAKNETEIISISEKAINLFRDRQSYGYLTGTCIDVLEVAHVRGNEVLFETYRGIAQNVLEEGYSPLDEKRVREKYERKLQAILGAR